MMETLAGHQKSGVNVLRRAFQIVEILSEDPRGRGVLQLAEESGLAPSTTHRILKTLVEAGYVRQEKASGAYRLTGRLADIGSRAVANRELREEAVPLLRQLRDLTGESSHLAVLDGVHALTVESLLSPERNLVCSRVGERQPLHCTAVGKALLAFVTPDQMEALLAEAELTRFTEKTICTLAGLREDLQRARSAGYAIDWDENENGIRCIAAPVRDLRGNTVACVGISGPAVRINDSTLPRMAEHVVEVASSLSRAMGFEPEAGGASDDR